MNRSNILSVRLKKITAIALDSQTLCLFCMRELKTDKNERFELFALNLRAMLNQNKKIVDKDLHETATMVKEL
jgi:hypothetical protein